MYIQYIVCIHSYVCVHTVYSLHTLVQLPTHKVMLRDAVLAVCSSQCDCHLCSLRRHVAAINKLSEAGMHFWDYGNGFLKEAGQAEAAVFQHGKHNGPFCYPSYVEDIMG